MAENCEDFGRSKMVFAAALSFCELFGLQFPFYKRERETDPEAFLLPQLHKSQSTHFVLVCRFALPRKNNQKAIMPPFEGFDPINLRQASSLYDNIVDEVNSYSSGLKGKFQISFHSSREDVVATRDIIVSKHPLYEPGTPEWDEYVLGKARAAEEQKQQEEQSIKAEVHPNDTKQTSSNSKKHGKRSNRGRFGPSGCQNPSDALEWLEMFTTMCSVPKPPPNCSTWTAHDLEPREEEMKTEVRRKFSMQTEVHRTPSMQNEDVVGSMPKPFIHKNRVLYPIAKYPSRLDSQRLVEQRRKFLENQINFKPLGLDTRKPRKPKKI